MAEVAEAPILQVGGAYALVIIGIIALLILSVLNPLVAATIAQGADPATVVIIYATFWSDLILFIAAAFMWGAKTIIYGLTTITTVPALIDRLVHGDLLAFLLVSYAYQTYFETVIGFFWQLLECFLLRMSNTITPGEIPDLFIKIVNW